ncbi:MAG: phospho-sugar mutase, partial [Clostridia bacterium]|nr:phospho-sugar mutase [Clostridia bacterium]
MNDYNSWKEKVKDEQLLTELENMSEDEIKDAFDGYLAFGTAGLRGLMRPGTNAMNIYTVGRATQGLANYIKEMGKEKDGVLIAFDSRNNSRKFAAVATNVLLANGIKVYTFKDIKGVPQTSFGIRKLDCFCGVIITASHNPKDYNGYKVFDFTGSQIGVKTADVLIGYMNKIDEFEDVLGGENEVFSDKCIFVDDEVLHAYYEQIKTIAEKKHLMGDNSINIVYTPLHGAGYIPVKHIFDLCGYKNVRIVGEQTEPNGDFPGVKQPNPEKADCYEIAKKYAENADVILATDPDCDRLGVMIKNDKNEFMLLTGNQVGCLLFEFLCRTCEGGFNPFAVRSIVSTPMVDKIADKYGVNMYKVLTGFRYVAGRIRDIHDTFEGNFFFGFEESNGYLVGDFIRDKDGCLGALLTAAMVLDYKKQGKTVY